MCARARSLLAFFFLASPHTHRTMIHVNVLSMHIFTIMFDRLQRLAAILIQIVSQSTVRVCLYVIRACWSHILNVTSFHYMYIWLHNSNTYQIIDAYMDVVQFRCHMHFNIIFIYSIIVQTAHFSLYYSTFWCNNTISVYRKISPCYAQYAAQRYHQWIRFIVTHV